MRDRLVQFGCFYQTRSIVTRLQTGVVRTNCMDSLDRTNVVQSLIAAENLNSVLKNVGILHNNDVIDNHQGNLLKGMDNKTVKGQLFRNVLLVSSNLPKKLPQLLKRGQIKKSP